jgi:hypothetical protein
MNYPSGIIGGATRSIVESTDTKGRATRLSDRRRLLLTAFVLSVIVTGAILLLVAVVPSRYLNHFETKWIRFVVVTSFFIWYTLKAFWKVRKRPAFWAIFLTVLITHVWGIGQFFYRGNGVSLVTFMLAGMAEFACMGLAIYWVLGVSPENVSLEIWRGSVDR